MSTASTPINVSAPLELEWHTEKATSEYCIYMYFAEVVKLKANHSRSFNITLNGKHWYGPATPKYLRTGMVHTRSILEINQTYDFLFSKIENSTLPPIINALEIYSTIDLTQLGTAIQDGMFSSTRQSSALHFFFFPNLFGCIWKCYSWCCHKYQVNLCSAEKLGRRSVSPKSILMGRFKL